MPFDWKQLEPSAELSESRKTLLRELAEAFLTTGAGSPAHQKKVQLGKDRNLLNELVQMGLIRNNWDKYYPMFPALYYTSSALRDSYAAILDLIFRAIKALYEGAGPQRFSSPQVESQLNVLITGSRPEELVRMIKSDAYIQRAGLFVQEFTHFVLVQESNDPDAPLGSLIATDNIFDYENLQQAWQEQLKARPLPNLLFGQTRNEPRGTNKSGARNTELASLPTVQKAKANWLPTDLKIIESLPEGGQGWTYKVKRITEPDGKLYVLKRLKNPKRLG
jgi:hypothetical protein